MSTGEWCDCPGHNIPSLGSGVFGLYKYFDEDLQLYTIFVGSSEVATQYVAYEVASGEGPTYHETIEQAKIAGFFRRYA